MAFHPIRGTRVVTGAMASDESFGNNGAFIVGSPEPGWELWFIASDGMEWEHVSVRATNGTRSRTPTWREMCDVKALCWDDEDVVIQFHPAKSQYVNNHKHVLHLWRPIGRELPTPDSIMVGVLTA